MSANPYPTFGTFFPDGDSLTGIIATSVYQGRLTFKPTGHADGRLDAVISGHQVGYAAPRPPIARPMAYDVVLDTSLLPGQHRLVLLQNEGCYSLHKQA